MRKIALIGLLGLLVACSRTPDVEPVTHACASMPKGRASACACVIGNEAYVFAGRAGNVYLNDLWRYSAAEDAWTDLGTTPLKERVKAIMVAHADKLYLGLGYSAPHAYVDTAYQCDWWEYTPATKQWKQLADFPTTNSVAALSYAVGNTIYVLFGNGRFFTNEVFAYEISTDTWSVVPGNGTRSKPCFGPTGAMKEDILYFGTGFDSHNLDWWYAVRLSDDRWEQKASVPGKGRHWCASTAGGEHIYLFGGRYFAGEMTGGEVFESYLRYAPETDKWETCGTMPCGRAENMVAFTINGKAYFGLGENENGTILNSLYRIEE